MPRTADLPLVSDRSPTRRFAEPGAVLRGLVPLLTVWLIGCGAVGQRPVDDRPFRFVDAVSGAAIDEVLVIPSYSSAAGISSGGGHGPGRMTHASFLARPFVYRSATPFTLTPPSSAALFVGNAFAGRSVTIRGMTVVAAGHRPAWIWKLWDRNASEAVRLTPLDEADWGAQRARLQTILASPRIRGADLNEDERQAFSMIADDECDVRFSGAEQAMLRDRFARATRRSRP